MQIAQISPLHESIPPRRYGGTERVVHYLTEELVRRGHGVVLFASGDSQTSAELYPCVPEALRLAGYSGDPTVPELIQLDQLMEEIDRFDVLHFHTGASHYPLARQLPVPHLNTLHGPLSNPGRAQLFQRFHQLPLVSISEAQRQPLPEAHWLGTVYHGLPLDLYQPVREPDEYLAFVGRISPEKRLDRAIAIASQLGLPLRVAAKIDSSDQGYYRNSVAPLIEGNPLVEFVGEVDDAGKQELLGNALALLFPIDWAEPFGLVMIEANACGTPVIAWRNGSTPEIIRPGLNGVLVDTIAEAVAAVRQLERLDRQAIRRDFELRFSVTRQADEYEQLYEHLAETRGIAESRRPLHRPCPPLDPLLHAA
ncbi:MAG: glycosyltransferase family 4 protein [Cyanobium sp.]